MTEIPEPSDAQWAAIRACGEFLGGRDQIFRLFGAAGVGKTTIIQRIMQEYPDSGPYYPIALSGKAVDVMRSKGLPQAQTIHSLLYQPAVPSAATIESLFADLENAKSKSRQAEIRRELTRLTDLKWNYSQFYQEALEKGVSGTIILEEASMVGQSTVEDLLGLGLQIIAVGDPFQLPPVQDKAFLTTTKPDVFLTEVHRQALESGVYRLATQIRNREPIAARKEADCLVVNSPAMNTGPLLSKFTQVLCGKHATRLRLNAQIREALNYHDCTPQVGERLICTKNKAVASTGGAEAVEVFNGQNLIVEEAHGTYSNAAVDLSLRKAANDETLRQEVYDGEFLDHYDFDPDRRFRDHRRKQELFQADYGYAITCHKAQGSEYPHVYIVDDAFGNSVEERIRWLYTAVTRAQESVVLNTPLAA